MGSDNSVWHSKHSNELYLIDLCNSHYISLTRDCSRISVIQKLFIIFYHLHENVHRTKENCSLQLSVN